MNTDFGAYGKIPEKGDFIRFNLPNGFAQVWDDWLQTSLEATRGQLGNGWDAAYLSAPIWRFTLRHGTVGADQISGILMPSVDRVGRQFPFSIIWPDRNKDVAAAHFAAETLFEKVEDVALGLLDEAISHADLSTHLDALACPHAPEPTLLSLPFVGSTSAQSVLAAGALSRTIAGQSIWSTGAIPEHRFFLNAGLPNIKTFGAMFDLTSEFWAPNNARHIA